MTRFGLNPDNNTESHKLCSELNNKKGMNISEDKLEELMRNKVVFWRVLGS